MLLAFLTYANWALIAIGKVNKETIEEATGNQVGNVLLPAREVLILFSNPAQW